MAEREESERDTLRPAAPDDWDTFLREAPSTLGRSVSIGQGALALIAAAAAGDQDEIVHLGRSLGESLQELLADFDLNLAVELLKAGDS